MLGGVLHIFESYLNLVISDALELSLCHLEWFAIPGYLARADSKARGRAEDETLCWPRVLTRGQIPHRLRSEWVPENQTCTIVSSG